jgi:hypothetical protein
MIRSPEQRLTSSVTGPLSERDMMTNMNNIIEFYSQLKVAPHSYGSLPFDEQLKMTPSSKIPWFEFFMADFPREAILKEVAALKSLFVEHREGELHRGWKSLCLHGLSAQKTMCHFDYGISKEDAKYQWTEIAQECPETLYYFRHVFPAESFERIRFMLVEPGGFVGPHRDRDSNSLGPLSIALNAPENCRFGLENHGLIPIKAGGFYLIDLSNRHSVWNQSEIDRFHITVESYHGKFFYKYMFHLLKTFEKNHPVKRWFNRDYHLTKRRIINELKLK